MNSAEVTFLGIFAALNTIVTTYAFYQCRQKKNSFGATTLLYPLGMYVWGDAVIFGAFWTGSAILSLLLADWVLFLLIFSTFWLVRSIGETMYWFNQQFSTVMREKPESHFIHKIFYNDSVWFVFQITNQCLTVITTITTVYLFHIWLKVQ